jgi:hypothetical protein
MSRMARANPWNMAESRIAALLACVGILATPACGSVDKSSKAGSAGDSGSESTGGDESDSSGASEGDKRDDTGGTSAGATAAGGRTAAGGGVATGGSVAGGGGAGGRVQVGSGGISTGGRSGFGGRVGDGGSSPGGAGTGGSGVAGTGEGGAGTGGNAVAGESGSGTGGSGLGGATAGGDGGGGTNAGGTAGQAGSPTEERCPESTDYVGDPAWQLELTVTQNGTNYCGAYDEARTLEEEFAARATLSIPAGTCRLPETPGTYAFALPVCIERGPGVAGPSFDGAGTVVAERMTAYGTDFYTHDFTQPLASEAGSPWSFNGGLEYMSDEGVFPTPIVFDGGGFDNMSGYRFSLCEGTDCANVRGISFGACGLKVLGIGEGELPTVETTKCDLSSIEAHTATDLTSG